MHRYMLERGQASKIEREGSEQDLEREERGERNWRREGAERGETNCIYIYTR